MWDVCVGEMVLPMVCVSVYVPTHLPGHRRTWDGDSQHHTPNSGQPDLPSSPMHHGPVVGQSVEDLPGLGASPDQG